MLRSRGAKRRQLPGAGAYGVGGIDRCVQCMQARERGCWALLTIQVELLDGTLPSLEVDLESLGQSHETVVEDLVAGQLELPHLESRRPTNTRAAVPKQPQPSVR